MQPLALCSLTLLTTAAACAQTPQPALPPTQPPAPIERRAPAVVSGISTWPTLQALHPGTHLILTTNSPYAAPYACRLDYLDADHIACRSSHHAPPTVFDRALIATIDENPPTHLRLGSTCFGTAGILVLAGLSCTAFSGPCAVVAATGLLAALVGFYINLISSVTDIHHSHYPTTVYIAPPSRRLKTAPATPASRAS